MPKELRVESWELSTLCEHSRKRGQQPQAVSQICRAPSLESPSPRHKDSTQRLEHSTEGISSSDSRPKDHSNC